MKEWKSRLISLKLAGFCPMVNQSRPRSKPNERSGQFLLLFLCDDFFRLVGRLQRSAIGLAEGGGGGVESHPRSPSAPLRSAGSRLLPFAKIRLQFPWRPDLKLTN